jgi:hypothetical protein
LRPGREAGGMSRPTELAITIAALPGRYGASDGWVCADEVRHRLRVFGFECSSQFVAAALARMASVDAPWLERRESAWGGPAEYRVTRWARNDIDNRLTHLRLEAPWIERGAGVLV